MPSVSVVDPPGTTQPDPWAWSLPGNGSGKKSNSLTTLVVPAVVVGAAVVVVVGAAVVVVAAVVGGGTVVAGSVVAEVDDGGGGASLVAGVTVVAVVAATTVVSTSSPKTWLSSPHPVNAAISTNARSSDLTRFTLVLLLIGRRRATTRPWRRRRSPR